MTRAIAMLLLVVGVVLAASSGSRNGERHVRYRQAQALVAQLEGVVAAVADCEGRTDCIGAAEAPLRASGALSPRQHAEAALAEAVAGRDAIGLPAPGERLTAWANVGGIGWLFGVVLIVAGAVVARRELAAEARGDRGATDEQVHFPAMVARIRARLDALADEIRDLPMDGDTAAAREALDALHADAVLPVVDGRAQFVAKHGIGAFAEYFSAFSSGERNLGRCWSALTDGHTVVARDALERARVAFGEAADAWDAIEVRLGGAPWQSGPTSPRRNLDESDVAEPRPRGMIERRTTAGAAALGRGDVRVDDDEPVHDPETVSDAESISDQTTLAASPDALERELELAEKEELRALVVEAHELLETLVDDPWDVDDSDAVVAAVYRAVEVLRSGDAPTQRWDVETAGRLLGLLWGEHLARITGWHWVWLGIGEREGYAVVSHDRAHALFPADHVRGLAQDRAGLNQLVLIYETVRDRKVVSSSPGNRTLLT